MSTLTLSKRRERACVPYQRGEVRQMLQLAHALRSETSILILFNMMMLQSAVQPEPDLNIDPQRDMVLYNVMVSDGLVDIVVVHHDGSATAVVVCDGGRGGDALANAQVSCKGLAASLKASMPSVTEVRAALLWTSTGDSFFDTLFQAMCQRQGIVPVMWGTLADSLAAVAPWAAAHRTGRRVAA